MELIERKSGLAIPYEELETEKPRGLLEVNDEEQREEVSDALLVLWDALRLSSYSMLSPIDYERRRLQHELLFNLGNLLLGKADNPEREVLC